MASMATNYPVPCVLLAALFLGCASDNKGQPSEGATGLQTSTATQGAAASLTGTATQGAASLTGTATQGGTVSQGAATTQGGATSMGGGTTRGATSMGGATTQGGATAQGSATTEGSVTTEDSATTQGGTETAGAVDTSDGTASTGGGNDGPCVDGKWTTTDVTQVGPFETVEEQVSGAVLYRPAEMLSGCLYPTITWGHGAGGQPSNYTAVLHVMASHGFVVIASTAANVQDGGNSGNQFNNGMVQVAQWVIDQNSDSSSPLFEKMDPEKIGAAGHSQGGYGASEAGQNPLIATSVSISGAVGSPNQNGPAFIICGGQDTFSGARCSDHPTDSYNGTSGVPVFFGTALDADHGNWGFGLSTVTEPHDIVQATVAWFRYYLMGDEAYRSWFMGDDCHLCNHANWSAQSKGFE